MAHSCHLHLWEAGGIVYSDEQYGLTHLQPVSCRSEYPGPVDAGLCSVHSSICSWSFIFLCSCPSLREQCLLVSTPQYWSVSHNIIFVGELLVHFVYMLRSVLQKDAVGASMCMTCLFCMVGKWRSIRNLG